MAALRNLFEAHWDAERMWRDFKRPVPSRPSPTHPLGGWEDMIRGEVTLACFFTSGFFVFCTGQLEAWVDIFNGGRGIDPGPNATAVNTTAGSGHSGQFDMTWGSCQPVSMDASVWWSYGSEDGAQAQCPASLRAGVDLDERGLPHDQTEQFKYYMAPNYNCWELEDERVPEDRPVCEWKEKDFEVLEMGMGFHQMAVRLLVWLCLNHIQFFVSKMVYSWFVGKTEKQEIAERKRELDQRKIMTKTLYPPKSSATTLGSRDSPALLSLRELEVQLTDVTRESSRMLEQEFDGAASRMDSAMEVEEEAASAEGTGRLVVRSLEAGASP